MHVQLGKILDKRYKKTKKTQLATVEELGAKARYSAFPPLLPRRHTPPPKWWGDHLNHPSDLTLDAPLHVQSLSSVRHFVIPWTVAHQAALALGDFPGKSAGEGCRFLLPGIFLTQGSSPACLLPSTQKRNKLAPTAPRERAKEPAGSHSPAAAAAAPIKPCLDFLSASDQFLLIKEARNPSSNIYININCIFSLPSSHSILSEHLICSRPHPKHWRDSGEQDKTGSLNHRALKHQNLMSEQ